MLAKLAAAMIRLRLAKGLTQAQLASLLNTKQESIARLESGSSLPSLSTVRRVADALDAQLEINLLPKQRPFKDSFRCLNAILCFLLHPVWQGQGQKTASKYDSIK